MIDEILANIENILTYLIDHTDNPFIISRSNLIREKMGQIRERKIISKSTLDDFCDYIINKDINMMKRVISEETKTEYRKMDELIVFIEQLRNEYFNEVTMMED